MTERATPTFDPRNLHAAVGEPSIMRDCSLERGWQVALLRTYHCTGDAETFETEPSDDQKIVVNLSGHEELRCLSGGLWRSGIKRAGSIGMTPPDEGARLQWHSLEPDGFTTAHLYVPQALFAESREERRRAGTHTGDQRLNTLAFDDTMIATIVRDLLRGLRGGATELFAEERVRLMVSWLTSSTAEFAEDPTRNPGTIGEARLKRALEFMSFDLSATPSLSEIANVADVSVYHFVRLFRQATGLPPHAYLTEIRLDTARKMLERSDIPISDIGQRIGYPVPRNFSAAFSRRFGASPGAWRREHHQRSFAVV